jgi:eukaryotic-like serine/threonine-protein kinase
MRASVQGGKEEIRASVLKTYLLRVRAEKGEAALRKLLATAGIDNTVVDNERAWLSVSGALKALRAIADILGKDALADRGEWVVSAEALGTLVRMLRVAKEPSDAYRYLADNAKEVTRVGTWECELEGTTRAKVTYGPRTDAEEPVAKNASADEELFCAARIGELTSYPRIWGLPPATVEHPTCLAKKGETCTYLVSWAQPTKRKGQPFVLAGIAALVLGTLVALTGTWIAGLVAALAGGAAGYVFGTMRDRSAGEETQRAFERHRIAALERGLELKGEHGQQAPAGELAGTVLGGKYKIGRKIGSGGIGVVYAAEHTALGHEVAVKVLRGAAARDGSEIARLRREAHIQTHVEHPNVARVMDLDQMPDGSIYVVMERLVGRSLADRLQREGLLAPGFAIPVFVDVCRGLAAAHAKGVVHRDLKPGNIFLCDDGTAKVLDFGMSKLTNAEALTQQGYTLGTPEYMAPEQCIGAPVEPRTDVYALGVLMYESLTGELPISSQNRRELLDLHQRKIPDRMLERRPDLPIPEALDAAVMQCLEKRAVDRPSSASELGDRLAAISLEGLPRSYPSGTARKRLRKTASGDGPKEPTPLPGAGVERGNDLETVSKLKSDPPPAEGS